MALALSLLMLTGIFVLGSAYLFASLGILISPLAMVIGMMLDGMAKGSVEAAEELLGANHGGHRGHPTRNVSQFSAKTILVRLPTVLAGVLIILSVYNVSMH